MMKEKQYKHRFQAVTSEIERVNEFIFLSLKDSKLDKKNLQKLELIAEEVFVNVASYAYTDDKGFLDFTITITQNAIVFEFCDYGIEFNPLSKELPDVTLKAEERKIGGLGIFFLTKFSDEIKYERKSCANVLTITKYQNCGGNNEKAKTD